MNCHCGLTLALRVGEIPTFVDHDILPAISLQVGVQPVDVGFELLLGDAKPIRIPTVPAHRRRGGELSERVVEMKPTSIMPRSVRMAFPIMMGTRSTFGSGVGLLLGWWSSRGAGRRPWRSSLAGKVRVGELVSWTAPAR